MSEVKDELLKQRERIDRRQFARRAGSLAAAALLPLAEEAKSQAQTDEFNDWPEDFTPVDRGEVRAKYANLLRVYGERLSDDEKKRARETLLRHQRSLKTVRAIKTENWDPMSTTTRMEELGEQTPR